MKKVLLSALLVASIAGIVAIFGCSSSPPTKAKTAEEVRMEYFGRSKVVSDGVNDYTVSDDGQMIIFSSAPIEGGSTLEHEKEYLKEYKNVMAAVSRWKREHADTKVLIAVSERGGHVEHIQKAANYTVRVTLLRE